MLFDVNWKLDTFRANPSAPAIFARISRFAWSGHVQGEPIGAGDIRAYQPVRLVHGRFPRGVTAVEVNRNICLRLENGEGVLNEVDAHCLVRRG